MKYTNLLLILIVSLVYVHQAKAQLPSTKIYSFDLKSNEEKVLLTNPKFLTSFNSEGYNNQPHFINDNELLITSNYQSSGLTDILLLRIDDQKITRITKTEESEYSAQTMENGFDFSVVRQELDDSQAVPQVLWAYPMDRSESGSQIIPDLSNIGYYAWLTKDKIALFLVTDPSELVIYSLRSGSFTSVAEDVGRCLKVDQNSNLYYLKNNIDGAEIRSFDTYLGRSKKIANAFLNLTDFDILPNGHIIAGDGSKLKTFNPTRSSSWTELKDLKAAGINKISRISSSQNRIAIVSD